MSCANEKKDNCIIFWINNPDLSIEYLDNSDYLECIQRFPEYIKINFSEIEKFDMDCQVFILKEIIDLDRFHQIANHEQRYVTIVIDSKIVLNGINGSVLLPASISTKLEPFKHIIDLRERKYLVISKKLVSEEFTKRDSVDKELKALIYKKIKEFKE